MLWVSAPPEIKSACRYGLTAEQIKEVEEQLEEIRAAQQKEAPGGSAAAGSGGLMGE